MKRIMTVLAAAAFVSVITVVPAFATHLPAPSFDHPGQVERCESTNPHNNPAFARLPLAQQEGQHNLWHSECDLVIPNTHG